jgi:hypothetical protein
MAKRSKHHVPTLEDLSKPSRSCLQHGAFSDLQRDADPQTGTPVAHRRAIDTLGAMLANGTITDGMHDAGVRFRSQFRAAALDALTVPRSGAGCADRHAHAARARGHR